MNKNIGVFDSGYGGLSVLKEIVHKLPQYNYTYLGDNLRAPYGTRSFETVYAFTLECVRWLFQHDCALVILACNTASAKALRTLQQNDLASFGEDRKVLGVIRPTSEVIGNYTRGNVGIFGTTGTVQSASYLMEIQKFFPHIKVTQEACPMWVPLIENNEHLSDGADYFVKKHVDALLHKDDKIDAILLACTHYPLLMPKIRQFVPEHIKIITQGTIVAESLGDYLIRHTEIEQLLGKQGERHFFTTGEVVNFNHNATAFYGEEVKASHIHL